MLEKDVERPEQGPRVGFYLCPRASAAASPVASKYMQLQVTEASDCEQRPGSSTHGCFSFGFHADQNMDTAVVEGPAQLQGGQSLAQTNSISWLPPGKLLLGLRG